MPIDYNTLQPLQLVSVPLQNESADTQAVKQTSTDLVSELLQPGLAAVEQRLRPASRDHHHLLITASEQIVRAGGKRIRPAYSLLAAGISGAEFQHSVSLAAGVEMLHTATLVHDDVIDNASLRRGAPTLNANGSANMAILMGDYLFAYAASLVAQTGNVRIMELFAETLMVIINGEVNQHFSKWRSDRQEYEQRIYAKTAALFVLAVQAAAVLGDADEPSTQALVDFGRDTGMAFQIVDDVLDFTSAAESIGKPAGNDLRQGLLTLPAIYYHEANPDDLQMKTILKTAREDHPEIPDLVDKIRQSPAMEAAMQEARRLARQGQQALESLPPSPHRDALAALARSVVERAY
jgi:geranylgeranyl pyrophosphate synthase